MAEYLREIILDTETTGLDPQQGHRIIEIGCIELINKNRTGKSFHSYCYPERLVPLDAQRIHGITDEFLVGKPLFSEVAQEFCEFIQDAKLVIHNATFDVKFLNYELKLMNMPIITMEKVVDTLVMARRKFPGARASLDALCQRFNINLNSRSKHGALVDAELLASVYVELCGGPQTRLELEILKERETFILQEKTNDRVKRSFPLSEEESDLHKKFMEEIPKNLWYKENTS